MRSKSAIVKFLTTVLSILVYTNCYSQFDEDEIRDFNRYAHFGLSTFEWISIAVGIVLLLIYREVKTKNKSFATILAVIGVIAIIPLVLVILALAQKAIGYAIALAVVVGALYFLFGNKK